MSEILTQNNSQMLEIGRVGIDKIIFNCIDIKIIDEGKLKSKGGANCYFTIVDGLLRKLIIKKQDCFVFLVLEPEYGNCSLTVSVENIKDTNISNIQYTQYMDHVKNTINPMLQVEYGLLLIIERIQAKYMEVNITILTRYPVERYRRAIELLTVKVSARNIKRKYSRQRQTQHTEDAETIMFSNQYHTEIKFYNKGKQMEGEKKVKINENLLRIEFCLKKSEVIKQYFCLREKDRENKPVDLESEIKKGFHRFFENNIFEPFRKWNEEREKMLYKCLVKNKKGYGKNWAEYTIDDCKDSELGDQCGKSLLLDYEELLIANDTYDLLNNKEQKTRSAKPLIERMKRKKSHFYRDNTIGKIEEIVNAILRACDKPEYHMYDEIPVRQAKNISIMKTNKRADKIKDVNQFVDSLQLEKWEKIASLFMDEPLGEIKLNDLKSKITIFEDEKKQCGYACYNHFYYLIPDGVLQELKRMFVELKDRK